MRILNKSISSKFLATGLMAVASVAIIGLGSESIAHAAPGEYNWTGTDCNAAAPATPNCSWSDANNWDAGVPINGSSLVFDQGDMQPAQVSATAPTNDISSLSVSTLTLQSSKGNLTDQLKIVGNPISVTSGIVVDADVPTFINMDITLGGDVIVSGTTANFLNIGDVNGLNKIALGGHSLTFTTPYGVDINSAISGAGSVVYNHAGASFATNLGNTYSGTTVVLAGTVAGTVSVFGTSTVSVSNNALVKFIGLANGSISNAITVQGVTSGTQVTSLSFASPNPYGATVTVPNITLQGATEFSNLSSPNLIIDLSGIKANNFCIEYLGASNDVTNGVANGFTNGPTGCILSTKVVTPNTAVNFISANPFVVVILGFITTGAIVLVSRKQLQKK